MKKSLFEGSWEIIHILVLIIFKNERNSECYKPEYSIMSSVFYIFSHMKTSEWGPATHWVKMLLVMGSNPYGLFDRHSS